MISRGISSTLQRVMKPTIALTDVHVDIVQIIFDGLLLIGCQAVDLILVRSHLPQTNAQTKRSSGSVAAFVRFLIFAAYRDVECGARVALGGGQEARWAQPRAWVEPRNLHNGCRAAHRRRFVNEIGDSVMAASGLSQRAARAMARR